MEFHFEIIINPEIPCETATTSANNLTKGGERTTKEVVIG